MVKPHRDKFHNLWKCDQYNIEKNIVIGISFENWPCKTLHIFKDG